MTDFREYTMLAPKKLAEYVGFTETEVQNLCNQYGMDFEEAKRWYDGYSFSKEKSVYSLNSVIGSLIIGGMLLVFANRKSHSNPYIVVLQCENHDSEVRAREYLDKHVLCCVVKSKAAQKGSVELNMEIRLRDDNTDFVNELSEMDGVRSAVLVSYNGDYMG